MFKIFFTNFNYYANQEFKDIFSALKFAEEKGFECRIDSNEEHILSWSPIAGVKWNEEFAQMTTEKAAFLLGLSNVRVRQFCQAGRLGSKFSHIYLITLDELLEFVKIPRVDGRPKNQQEYKNVRK